MSGSVKETLKTIVEELGTLFSNLNEEEVSSLINVIEDKREKKIYFVAQGRSGLIARAFAMRLMHLGFNAFVAGETITPGIEKEDLVIACSGSGETGITCYLADKAKEIGAVIIAIAANRDSRLAEIADIVVVIPKEHSIQHPGSLFEQGLLLLLDAIVVLLRERGAGTSDSMNVRHTSLE